MQNMISLGDTKCDIWYWVQDSNDIVPCCPYNVKYEFFVIQWTENAKYDIESMWLKWNEYFVSSRWLLDVIYDWKFGFEPHWPYMQNMICLGDVKCDIWYRIEGSNDIVPRCP
jgi:hypothetical protein